MATIGIGTVYLGSSQQGENFCLFWWDFSHIWKANDNCRYFLQGGYAIIHFLSPKPWILLILSDFYVRYNSSFQASKWRNYDLNSFVSRKIYVTKRFTLKKYAWRTVSHLEKYAWRAVCHLEKYAWRTVSHLEKYAWRTVSPRKIRVTDRFTPRKICVTDRFMRDGPFHTRKICVTDRFHIQKNMREELFHS